jgi:hypothetical protein
MSVLIVPDKIQVYENNRSSSKIIFKSLSIVELHFNLATVDGQNFSSMCTKPYRLEYLRDCSICPHYQ